MLMKTWNFLRKLIGGSNRSSASEFQVNLKHIRSIGGDHFWVPAARPMLRLALGCSWVAISSRLRRLPQRASATQQKLDHAASKTAHIREPQKYSYLYKHLDNLLPGATLQTLELYSRGRARTKSALPWTRTQNPAERLHLVVPSGHPSLTWSASPRSPAAIYRNLRASVNFSDYTDLSWQF